MSGFRRATRQQMKARVALVGPSGSGKTWTALQWATVLADGGTIGLVDTENRSSELYSDEYTFDVADWQPPYDPTKLAKTLRDAAAAYDVVVIDSLSHFWEGEGGTLDIADNAGRKVQGNSFAGWKEATPALRHLIDTTRNLDAHVIATMRVKTEYVLETNERGKQVPRRVGLAPVMRGGVEYEFTVVGDIDLDHRISITKSRCKPLADQVYPKGRSDEAAAVFKAWLVDGEPMASAEQTEAIAAAFDRIENEADRKAAKRAFVAEWGRPETLTAARAELALAALGGAS